MAATRWRSPAITIGFFYEELDGCTWDVEAQYGDGSEPGEYVFSETDGLEAEHTYPEPGVYTFDAYATEGLHDGTSEPCPDLHIQATVTYPEPPPPKEPEEPEPEEPVKVPAGGSGVAATAAGFSHRTSSSRRRRSTGSGAIAARTSAPTASPAPRPAG